MSKLYSFKLFSHRNPDKLLFEHLKNTAEFSKKIINEKTLNLENIKKEILSNISYIIGLSHDIGKATKYFQEYLNEKDEKKKNSLKNSKETHHSFLSSLFAYYLVKNFIENNLNENKITRYLPIISYFIVKRHHGNLHNAFDEVYFDENEEEIVKKQLENIDYEELQKIFDISLSNIKIRDIADILIKNYKNDIFKKDKKIIRDELKNNEDLSIYFITQLLYSVLLNADKSDVILDKDKSIERQNIDPNIVDNFKKKEFIINQNTIHKLRDEIYNEIINNIGEISLDDKIFSLNAPTGTGKTLASLSFALKLRDKVKNEKGFIPKIIYSLPFLSIIDQNFNVFEKMFLKIDGKLPNSNTLLKHHHLSDIYYKTEENEFEIDEAELLIESWNSEIIVTTFWQFFHTIFSNRNSLIKKFHNLVNSIIILDEIQAIPHRYWRLIKEALKFISEKFNSFIVLSTATLPLIFDNKEVKELVKNKEKYFNSIDRVKLNLNLEEISLDEFKNILEKDIIKNEDKDFLIVLNTIGTSIQVFNFVKELKLSNTKLYYLSTNIIPKERVKRINEIRQSNEYKLRKIIVSTQLIEAGVDIDADIVYRDFAPLDSINQVSGRCNRNYTKIKGNVNIFIIKDKKQECYKRIYDGFIISKTKDILYGKEVVEESKMLKLNNEYFLAIKKGMSDDESNKNLQFLFNLSFSHIGEKFKLIEEDHYKIDVFIEADEEAKKIWEEFKNIKEIKDPFERKVEFLKIRNKFYEYVISVEEYGDGINKELGIGYISMEEKNNYYCDETGFKRKNYGMGTFFT